MFKSTLCELPRLYTMWMILSERQKLSSVNIDIYLRVYMIILYLLLSACVPGTYVCFRIRAWVTLMRECTHTWTLHVYMSNAFTWWYISCVCARMCVLSSEMECVLFYSRKIAHRANVICCIIYPISNKFYLILSILYTQHLSISLFTPANKNTL